MKMFVMIALISLITVSTACATTYQVNKNKTYSSVNDVPPLKTDDSFEAKKVEEECPQGIKLSCYTPTVSCTPIENSCNALQPTCGKQTVGVNNCGQTCYKVGICITPPDTSDPCTARTPKCGETTVGIDKRTNTYCKKIGPPCPQPTGECEIKLKVKCDEINKL